MIYTQEQSTIRKHLNVLSGFRNAEIQLTPLTILLRASNFVSRYHVIIAALLSMGH
jgi:hypothetical protein